MYKVKKQYKTSINLNNSIEGETLENKIERIVNNREPITDGAPLVFTERKDGVVPAYNIRTDRFEIAIEAMDKVSATHKAKRENKAKSAEMKIVDGGADTTQGTGTEN
jgi:hypothetical protein